MGHIDKSIAEPKPIPATIIMRRGFQRLVMSVLFVFALCIYRASAQHLGAPPELSVPPSENDWTYYCNSLHKVEATDHLKCIKIGRKSRLSLTGELRNRGEYFDHITLGANSPSSGYLLQSYMLSGDLELGNKFRVFSTLQSGLENGRTGGPRPSVDED